MSRPRLLDLFCGAGGAAMGYHRAGFEVVGVDINPQPHYPFEFHQADALTFPLDGFDAIHASPPCQRWSALAGRTGRHYPDLLTPMRARLVANGRRPWVIENVPGAKPLVAPLTLCGSQFGLRTSDGRYELRRHRLFEINWWSLSLPYCQHGRLPVLGVYGTGGGGKQNRGTKAGVAQARDILGIDWMNRDELSQAIPPAYTEWIGRQLLAALESAA